MKKGILLGAATLMLMTAVPLVSMASNQNNTETNINTDAEFLAHFNNKWSSIENQLEAIAQNGQISASAATVPMTQLINLMNEGYDFLKMQFIGNETLMNQKMDNLNTRGELRSEIYKMSKNDTYSLAMVKQIVAAYKAEL
ncbi:MAG TPA: hypothetical protein VFD78_06410 [Chitinophagaceae bacterium]|nr:hypothetical protein [Chitinophagaceae bacterium]